MAKFGVNVTETSYGFIEIEADSLEEARSKAEDEYYKGEYTLDIKRVYQSGCYRIKLS